MTPALEFFRGIFANDFIPHGHCYFWQPDLVWLNAGSDTLIAAAYYSIPFSLYYFVRKRPELKLRGLILMFAGFILACGATHAVSVWNIWHSTYRLEGLIKVVTAILSVATAIVAVKLAPTALKIVSPDQLEAINGELTREVEARKLAEAKLRRMLESQYIASEARLHAYFETTSQAIIVMSADLRIRLVNHSTENMLGYERAELIGKPIEMLWPERMREEYGADRRRDFELRTAPNLRDRIYLCKDGHELPAETSLSFVDTDDGPLAFTMVTDLTERRRSARELERANARLTSYIEAALQGIVAVSADGRIAMVNRSTEQMFGYPRTELLGQPLEMLLPTGRRAAHVAHRVEFFSEPRIRRMESGLVLAGLRKDGTEFPVEIGLSYIETEQGLLSLGLINDITERKSAADRLARAHDDLLRSNQELEQFAYIASHDLQEPLRMVTGYLNLLDRRYRETLDGDAREFIGYAVDGATRMKGLIQDLLSVSRISRQALHLQPSSAGSLLNDALINLKVAIAESGATVTFDPLPEVLADGALLTQVFQNLVGNAIKFTNTAPRVHVSARLDGTDWIFSIQDNGIGIEQQHLDRIFRIFERLNDPARYAGSGIGLAITQRIIERHGGKIWVESPPGQGSTFYFSIPARAASIS